jgi:hypothetical protein
MNRIYFRVAAMRYAFPFLFISSMDQKSPLIHPSSAVMDPPSNSSLFAFSLLAFILLIIGILSDYVFFSPRVNLGFFLNDPAISHPIADPETVPSYLLIVNAAIVLVIISVIHIAIRKDHLHDKLFSVE